MSFLNFILKTDKWHKHYDELIIQNALVELLFFIIFLVIVSIISIDMSGTSMFYMSHVIKKLFIERPFLVDEELEITFEQICYFEDYWLYVNNVFIKNVYGELTVKNNIQNEHLTLLSENILLGPPRLKQLRVENDSCVIHELFQRNFRECFGAYQHSIEDLKPFGLKNGTAWTYHSSDELNDMFLYGILHTYSGGGFYYDLSLDGNETRMRIKELQDNFWITRGTRLVLIEFAAYNINENIFCIVKLIAEIPSTGGIVTSFSIKTVRLLTFVNSHDYFILYCEIVFLVMVCWYSIVESLQLYKESWLYFKSIWNIVDMAIVLMSFLSFVFSIIRFLHIEKKLKEFTKEPNEYISFDHLAFWQEKFNDLTAILVFLVWMKIFKYISFSKTMLQFCVTLKRCAMDLLGFGFMFLIAFIAYAQLGYILFGTENTNFRTFRDSLFTLLRTIIGDFDYLAIEHANRILGPVYFITYVFLMFFVLLNMFLAIIADTYSAVKNENICNDNHIGLYIKTKWNLMIIRLANFLPFVSKCRVKVRDQRKATNTSDDELSDKNPRNGNSVKVSLPFKEMFNIVEDDNFVHIVNGFNDRITKLEDSIDKIVVKFNRIMDDLKKTKN